MGYLCCMYNVKFFYLYCRYQSIPSINNKDKQENKKIKTVSKHLKNLKRVKV